VPLCPPDLLAQADLLGHVFHQEHHLLGPPLGGHGNQAAVVGARPQPGSAVGHALPRHRFTAVEDLRHAIRQPHLLKNDRWQETLKGLADDRAGLPAGLLNEIAVGRDGAQAPVHQDHGAGDAVEEHLEEHGIAVTDGFFRRLRGGWQVRFRCRAHGPSRRWSMLTKLYGGHGPVSSILHVVSSWTRRKVSRNASRS
jgi:hypothetical protein